MPGEGVQIGIEDSNLGNVCGDRAVGTLWVYDWQVWNVHVEPWQIAEIAMSLPLLVL